MNRDQHDDDFDDDDFMIIDGKRVLKDGRGFRTSITMLDSTQRAIAFRDTSAAHRPGWRLSDANDADDDVEDAHAEYCQWLRAAHRAPVADADYDEPPERPTSLADARAEAERAYEERSAWLRDAYKGQQP